MASNQTPLMAMEPAYSEDEINLVHAGFEIIRFKLNEDDVAVDPTTGVPIFGKTNLRELIKTIIAEGRMVICNDGTTYHADGSVTFSQVTDVLM